MDSFIFIAAWLFATTLMSGFSSLWSDITDDNFREHELLSHIFTKGKIPTFTINQWLMGWIIHFAFGAFFLGCYELLWNLTGVVRSLSWSILFGILIGILGVMGWILMFKFSKDRPKINENQYYIHLIIAHVVFSLSAYGVYSYIN